MSLPIPLPFLTTPNLTAAELSTLAMEPAATSAGAALMLSGKDEVNDGGHGTVLWEAESEEAPDEFVVFRPNIATPGRWRRTSDDGLYLGYFGLTGSKSAAANALAMADLEEWLNDPAGAYYNKMVKLLGRPGDVYLSNRGAVITRGLVHIDLNKSTWNSVERFEFDGDSGIDGDLSAMLPHVYFGNGFIGQGGTASTIAARGPKFIWCYDGGAYDLVKNCRSGTAFNASFCANVWFRNCKNFHGPTSGGAAIGFLFHMCDDCGATDCEVSGDGRIAYGYQFKGGSRCGLVRCTVHDITNGFSPGVAFRIRGDAPYKASATSPRTYPYDTLGWDEPDARRESRDCYIEDCRAWNCEDMNAVSAQEQARGVVRNLWARNVRNGVWALRPGNSLPGEGHGFHAFDIDVEANSRGVYFNGPLTTTEVIDEETGEVIEEVLGDGALFEGVVLDRFKVKSTGAGLEGARMERLLEPVIHNGTAISETGVGLSIRQGCRNPDLSDVVGISLAAMNGVLITSSVIHPRLNNVRGKNTTPTAVREVNVAALPSTYSDGQPLRSTSTGTSYAVLAAFTTAQDVAPSAAVEGGSNVGDGSVESISTLSGTVEEVITLTATDATHFDVEGSISGPIGTAEVGVPFESDEIHFLIVEGETPFAVDDVFTITITITPIGDVFRLEATVLGKETTGGGGYAEYHIMGVFRRVDDTTVAQIGATISVSTAIETDATWDGADFNIAGLAVQLRARAKAAVNVEWSAMCAVQLISAI